MSYISLTDNILGIKNSIEEIVARYISTRVLFDKESKSWVVYHTLKPYLESKTPYYYSATEYTKKEAVAKFYKEHGKRILEDNGHIFFKSI